MKKFFIFLIILLLSFFGIKCKKERQVGEYLLTDEMKATIPFHGNERIVIKDDWNNQIELIAGELQENYYKTYSVVFY